MYTNKYPSDSRTRAIVVRTGILGLLWGIWSMTPFVQVMDSTPAFKVALEIMPEWSWGLLIVGLSFVKLTANLLHLGWGIRAFTNFAVAAFWLVLSIAIAVSNWASTGFIVYIWLAVVCWECGMDRYARWRSVCGLKAAGHE